MRVRSLFLSDLHLGCRFSRAEELFQFLGRNYPLMINHAARHEVKLHHEFL